MTTMDADFGRGRKPADSDDLRVLRQQVQQRLEAYPARLWSARFLSALIALFDLEFGCGFGDGGLEAGHRPRLRIVK